MVTNMPKLWDETIESHRRAVRDATLDTAEALVTEHGLGGVTMSLIAQKTGIGRATLYKYFPDVEAILSAWHARMIAGHLARFAQIRDEDGDAGTRLRLVLEIYAFHTMGQQTSDLAARLHRGKHVLHAQHQLRGFIRDLLAEGARTGALRKDVSADELAHYCLHALAAASALPSKAAARRLVEVTMAGLRPQC